MLFRYGVRLQIALASRWRRWYYRRLGVRIASPVWLRAVEIPRNWSDITLGPRVKLDQGVVLLCSGPAAPDKLVIQAGTYVNRHTMFDAHQRLQIGRDCMIGPFCYFTDANHGLAAERPVQEQPMTPSPVVVDDEVWIGAGVIVLAGAHLGRGAVRGAGSVVTGDIPPYTVALGRPARVIRERT